MISGCNRRVFIWLIVFVSCFKLAFADIVGTLSVQVFTEDKKSILGVDVIVKKIGEDETLLSEHTDEAGIASFLNLPIGEYQVTVQGNLWQSQSQTAVIQVNALTKLSFSLSPKSEKVIKVSSKRLLMNAKDTAGSSSYKDRQFIETRMANNNSLNAVADLNPGVDQDSQGQIHFRGEHRSMTLELDGILLPIPLEAQVGSLVDPRFLDEMEIRTGSYDPTYSGALGGVLNLVTRRGGETPFEQISPIAGDHGELGTLVMAGGKDGDFNYFIGNSENHTGLRIEAPTPNFQTLNNQGDDENSLLHLSWNKPEDKINLTFGTQNLRLNIPNTPIEQNAGVNQWQRENNVFGVLSLRHQFSERFEMLFGLSYLGSHQAVGNNGVFNVWTPANPVTMPNAAAQSLPAFPEDPGNPFFAEFRSHRFSKNG